MSRCCGFTFFLYNTQKEEGCHFTKSGRTLLMVSCDFGLPLPKWDTKHGQRWTKMWVRVNLQGPKGNKESGLVRDSKDSPKHEGVKRKGMNDCNCARNIVFNVCLSILYVCLSVSLSVRPSICLSVCLILFYLICSFLIFLLLSYLIFSYFILYILSYLSLSIYLSIYPLQYPVCLKSKLSNLSKGSNPICCTNLCYQSVQQSTLCIVARSSNPHKPQRETWNV